MLPRLTEILRPIVPPDEKPSLKQIFVLLLYDFIVVKESSGSSKAWSDERKRAENVVLE